MTYIWYQNTINIPWLKSKVYNILLDQFKQSWYSEVHNSPKGLDYRIFKNSLDFEKYLLTLPTQLCKKYCNFRTGNAKLPIEIGRWFNIPRENRICKLCTCNEIGDEFHYLFKCTDVYISNSRVRCLPKYFITNPNVVKFEKLFNVTNINQLTNICKLLDTIFERVSSLG